MRAIGLHWIERRVNAEIAADREVCIRFLSRALAFAIPYLIRTKINLLLQLDTSDALGVSSVSLIYRYNVAREIPSVEQIS